MSPADFFGAVIAFTLAGSVAGFFIAARAIENSIADDLIAKAETELSDKGGRPRRIVGHLEEKIRGEWRQV